MRGVTAIKLDGQLYRNEIFEDLGKRTAALKEKGIVPGLATVLVGDDPASHSYVKMKHRDCEQIGINSIRKDLPADITQEELLAVIDELNNDPACTGYIVQLPLPKHIDQDVILEAMDPAKDADGLHPTNLGRLVLNVNRPMASPLPCTPRGIVELLTRYGVPLAGAEVCVIGRGVTVGRPLGLLLTRRDVNATVTLCHTGSRDVAAHARRADVLVAAAGVPGIVTADLVKPGAAVLDVGITRVVDESTGRTRLVGDVAPEAREVAGWVAPMPGGVGPMTRAMLLANVVEAAERQS